MRSCEIFDEWLIEIVCLKTMSTFVSYDQYDFCLFSLIVNWVKKQNDIA